jgi:hypothetical protein
MQSCEDPAAALLPWPEWRDLEHGLKPMPQLRRAALLPCQCEIFEVADGCRAAAARPNLPLPAGRCATPRSSVCWPSHDGLLAVGARAGDCFGTGFAGFGDRVAYRSTAGRGHGLGSGELFEVIGPRRIHFCGKSSSAITICSCSGCVQDRARSSLSGKFPPSSSTERNVQFLFVVSEPLSPTLKNFNLPERFSSSVAQPA